MYENVVQFVSHANANDNSSCSAINTCKTCDTFGGMGGKCSEIDYFPNATVAEYGTYSVMSDPKGAAHKIMAEIYARGPVATGVNAEPLVKYEGGIVTDTKIWHMMVRLDVAKKKL
jgi:cathepsin X